MTDWKQFEEMPDEGLFDKIQHRLSVRRAWRVGGTTAAVVVTVAAVAFGVATALQPRAEVDAGSAENLLAANVEAPSVTITEEAGGQSSVNLTPEQTTSPHGNPLASTSCPLRPEGVTTACSYDTVSEPNDVLQAPTTETLSAKEQTVKQPVVAASQAAPLASAASLADTTTAEATGDNEPSQKVGAPEPEPYHEDNLYWAPNIILPNGEREENRVFSIVFSSEVTEFNLHIYNRGGRRVYVSTDPGFVWDGTLNGAALPQGAYVWVATFRDSEGTAQRASGTVTVVR